MVKCVLIKVSGIVQGVGFRPFVYRLAKLFNLKGWVRNTTEGVEIKLYGKPENIENFIENLKKKSPPLSKINKILVKNLEDDKEKIDEFKIIETKEGKSFVFISPDISICEDCLKEFENSNDRRYKYPFINCTNCGPRYTIIKNLPYDRKNTTMSIFKMCRKCYNEYTNPLNRRFHAEPISCWECGPQIFIYKNKNEKICIKGKDDLKHLYAIFKEIENGKIIALKGIGGFHLIADPFDKRVVLRLRKIKNRLRKPFALMARNLEVAKKYAKINQISEKFLKSPVAPIVIVSKINHDDFEYIAPYIHNVGIMLPYSPLHLLIFDSVSLDFVIATSCNKRGEPLKKDFDLTLFEMADYVVDHNRFINMRIDDSVVRVENKRGVVVRRARGYVPLTLKVPDKLSKNVEIVAFGAELKNTISFYKDGYIIPSQYVGDLKSYKNFLYFQEVYNHLKNLFSVDEEIIGVDLHPQYFSTKFGLDLGKGRGIDIFKVPHHVAHILAVMVERGFYIEDGYVLGFSWDGLGYGLDGNIWGGEGFLLNYKNFKRVFHFDYVPLIGGDMAIREPRRMVFSYLWKYKLFDKFKISKKFYDKNLEIMVEKDINTFLTSSCGRLFDAVSYAIGCAFDEIDYDGEPPILLESYLWKNYEKIDWDKSYGFEFIFQNGKIILSLEKLWEGILSDLENGVERYEIGSKFINMLVEVIREVSFYFRKHFGVNVIVLSGGVFLNLLLVERIFEKMGDHFLILYPEGISPNDESISIGQIVYILGKL